MKNLTWKYCKKKNGNGKLSINQGGGRILGAPVLETGRYNGVFQEPRGGDETWRGRDLRGDDRGVCVEEPRCTVLSEPAVYREGLLEAPHMAGPEPADTARECV